MQCSFNVLFILGITARKLTQRQNECQKSVTLELNVQLASNATTTSATGGLLFFACARVNLPLCSTIFLEL